MAAQRHRRMFVENFLNTMVLSCLLVSCFCSPGPRQLMEETVTTRLHTHTTVRLSSLLPSSSCEASSSTPQQVDEKGSFLKVVHKYGPCAQLGLRKESVPPTHAEVLLRDQYRVKYIQSRFSKTISSSTSPSTSTEGLKDSQAIIPAASMIVSGEYVVTIGLGTPKKDLTLIFDTGSVLTWTQCEPCVGTCYKQEGPIFNPAHSKSYTNISCSSQVCSDLISATGITPSCSALTCVYKSVYSDNSSSTGFLAKEKLSLTPTDTFDNFFFGCGQNNTGDFGEAAGLLGLGQDKLSIVEQTAAKFGKYFSYCLPSRSSSTGYLAFGNSSRVRSSSVVFTPLATISLSSSFYGINIEGITVAGRKLSIPESIFSNAPSIIDSGTTLTKLPPTAYSALSRAFQHRMKRYPKVPGDYQFDTCYDLRNYTSASLVIPRISFLFRSGVRVDLHKSGVLYMLSESQVCLAFTANEVDTDILVYGNVQQKGMPVVYDVAGGKLGFGPHGCA